MSLSWPVCGKCCEVAFFPWLGGSHHCVLAEPGEADLALDGTGGSSLAQDLADLISIVIEEAVIATRGGALGVTLAAGGGVQLSGDGLGEAGAWAEAALHAWARYDVEFPDVVRFRPDRALFGTATVDAGVVLGRAHELAFRNPGLVVTVVDEPSDKTRTVHHPGGVSDYLQHINRTRTAIQRDVVHFRRTLLGTKVEIGLQWNASYTESVHAFVNSSNVGGTGLHTQGFRAALVSAINRYATRHGHRRKTERDLSDDVICEGLAAVVSVHSALSADDLNCFVETVFTEYLLNWFEDHVDDANKIVRKVVSSADAEFASRRSHCREYFTAPATATASRARS